MKKPLKEPDFPNLARIAEQDMELHVEKAIEMGATVDQAVEHARKEHAHGSLEHVEKDASSE